MKLQFWPIQKWRQYIHKYYVNGVSLIQYIRKLYLKNAATLYTKEKSIVPY